MPRRLYQYYQPNKKDLKDHVGDCQIRALSKVLNLSWVETFDLITPICREFQIMDIFSCDLEKTKDLPRPQLPLRQRSGARQTGLLQTGRHQPARYCRRRCAGWRGSAASPGFAWHHADDGRHRRRACHHAQGAKAI